jgi:hypothetical protein
MNSTPQETLKQVQGDKKDLFISLFVPDNCRLVLNCGAPPVKTKVRANHHFLETALTKSSVVIVQPKSASTFHNVAS